MKFTVAMLLTCILFRDVGLGWLIRSVCKILFTDIKFVLGCFSSETPCPTTRKLHVCFIHGRSYIFLASICL